jgi:hypothetical protein
MILAMASDEMSYLTGSAVVIDGRKPALMVRPSWSMFSC